MKKSDKNNMENKIVAIRVDSSVKLGAGHVMRCLTLADQLTNSGTEVFFICSELIGDMADLIEKKGYAVERIPYIETVQQGDVWENDLEYTQKIVVSIKKQVDWLIVDHYGLDAKWETGLRAYTRKIMVIDDLSDRKHNCDVLLDQNLYLDMETRYQGLVPNECRQLLGPKYVLLRPEFYEARKNLRQRDGKVRRILIFFGGSDSTNETGKTLEAIKILDRPDIFVDVVVGMANPNKENIKQICADASNATFYCQVDNMAELMVDADLAIGAGGTATWERCFLGLPTITLVVADNQIEVTEALAQAEAIWYLGISNFISSEEIATCLVKILNDPKNVVKKTKRAMWLMKNVNCRIVDILKI